MQKYLFRAALHPEVKTQLPETSLVGEIICFFGYEPVQPDVTPFPQRSLCMSFIYPRTEYNQQQIPYTTPQSGGIPRTTSASAPTACAAVNGGSTASIPTACRCLAPSRQTLDSALHTSPSVTVQHYIDLTTTSEVMVVDVNTVSTLGANT